MNHASIRTHLKLAPVLVLVLGSLPTGCIALDLPDLDDGGDPTTGATGGTDASGDSTGADESGGSVDETGGSLPPDPDDPAPECNEPGECTCDGCPTSDILTDDILAGSATTWSFSGVVNGAVGNGTFFIDGPGDQSFGGIIPTDPESGAFAFESPLFCGEQLVKCVWSNEAGQYVLVTRVITEDCIEPDIRVGLSWTELGDDFELHLVRPGGRINTSDDCTWTTCIGSGPDWGVEGDPTDDPRKDVDNTGAFGPENIVLAGPEEGIYTVLVEHWSSGDPMAPGTVTFNVDGTTTVVEIDALAPQEVWTAGTIAWPSGVVQTSQDVFDCSGSWASGCTAELP